MEELEKIVEDKSPFTITEKDFILCPLSEDNCAMYNLTFMKRVKKRDTGQYAIEPGKTLYGLTLRHALERIIKHRTAKKFEGENISLMTYIKELDKSYKEIVKLCKESIAEDFDTGD